MVPTRSLDDCTLVQKEVLVRDVLGASPAWWYTERAVGDCSGNEQYNIVCSPPCAVETTVGGRDLSSGAGIVVVAWKDIDARTRVAAVTAAADARGTGHGKRSGEHEIPDKDMGGEVKTCEVEKTSAEARRLLSVLSPPLLEQAPEYICVHGSFALTRLGSKAGGSSVSDQKCKVSVIQCESPSLRGHEVIFMAQEIDASANHPRNPCATYLIDYAASIAGKIYDEKAATPRGRRCLRRLSTRDKVRGAAMRVATPEHIRRGHSALKKAFLRSVSFLDITGDEGAGVRLREAALKGKAVIRSLPCNVLGLTASNDRKRAVDAMYTGLLGFSGLRDRDDVLDSVQEALRSSAGAYMYLLEYLHDMPVTQAVLKLLDMRAPSVLADVFRVRGDLILFKRCRSDVGVALFFIWLYQSSLRTGMTSSFNKSTLEHVLECHEHLLTQFEVRCLQVATDDDIFENVDDNMFESVEDLPRDWSAALASICRRKDVAVSGEPSAPFRTVFPQTFSQPKTALLTRRQRRGNARTAEQSKVEGAFDTDAARADNVVHVHAKPCTPEDDAPAEAPRIGGRRTRSMGMDPETQDSQETPGIAAQSSPPVKKRRPTQSTKAVTASSASDAGTKKGCRVDGGQSSAGTAANAEQRDDGAALSAETPQHAEESGQQDTPPQEAQEPSRSVHYLAGMQAGARALSALYIREGKTPGMLGRDAINRGYVKLCGVSASGAFSQSVESCFEPALNIATLVALHFSSLRQAHGICSMNVDSTGTDVLDKSGIRCCASQDGCKVRGDPWPPCPCSLCVETRLCEGGSILLYGTTGTGAVDGRRQAPVCQEYTAGLTLPGVRRVVLRRNGVYAAFKTRKPQVLSDDTEEHKRDAVGDEVLILRRQDGLWSVKDPESSSEDLQDNPRSWFLHTTPEYAAGLANICQNKSIAGFDKALGFVDSCVGLCLGQGSIATGEGLPVDQLPVLATSMELRVAVPGATKSFECHIDEGKTPLRDIWRPFIAVTPYPTRTSATKSTRTRPSPETSDATKTDMWIDVRTVPLPSNATLSAKLRQRSSSSSRATGVTEAEFYDAALALQIPEGDMFVQRCDTSYGVHNYSAASDVDSALASLDLVRDRTPWKQARALLQRLLTPQVVLLFESAHRVAE